MATSTLSDLIQFFRQDLVNFVRSSNTNFIEDLLTIASHGKKQETRDAGEFLRENLARYGG